MIEQITYLLFIKLPSGVFRPYAGVSTAILYFAKTGVGGTDRVWFYDLKADGYSLDDKRNPLLPPERLGAVPAEPLGAEEHPRNSIPDALRRWGEREGAERDNPRTAQSFCVPKHEIAAGGGYDLSHNWYREVEHEVQEQVSPRLIIRDLRELEGEILAGLSILERMLG